MSIKFSSMTTLAPAALLALLLHCAPTWAQRSSLDCVEMGGRKMCAGGDTRSLTAFSDCWVERARDIEAGRSPKPPADWLEPAASAAACMREKGVTSVAAKPPTGKPFCMIFGNYGPTTHAKWCRPAASADVFPVHQEYCMKVASLFYGVGVVPLNGGPTDTLGAILPCLQAHGWTVEEVVPKSRDPRNRVGATGKI